MIARSRNRHRSGGLESAAAEAAMLTAPITGVPEAGRFVHLTRFPCAPPRRTRGLHDHAARLLPGQLPGGLCFAFRCLADLRPGPWPGDYRGAEPLALGTARRVPPPGEAVLPPGPPPVNHKTTPAVTCQPGRQGGRTPGLNRQRNGSPPGRSTGGRRQREGVRANSDCLRNEQSTINPRAIDNWDCRPESGLSP